MNALHALRLATASAVVLAAAATAAADAGIPMIAVVWPASWLLFAPIVAVETAVARRCVGLPLGRALKATTLANLASTLVGIPATWFALLCVEFASPGLGGFGTDTTGGKLLSVTLQAPWLVPYEPQLDWMIPAAALFLLVPLCFVSVFVEAAVFRRVSGCDRRAARRWSWIANGITYGAIFAAVSVDLVWATATHTRK